MQLKIKTLKTSETYGKYHFFLLSKGYNTGKPLLKSCPNCYVVTCESEPEKQQLFWICFSLWKSGAYLPFLVGSVIPFIHVNDLRKLIESVATVVSQRLDDFSKAVDQLQTFHKLERQLELQLKLINRLKVDLCRRLIWSSL
jgi:hypothetical protein